MENELEVVDGRHHDHVILTMPWGLWILVGGDGHPNLGSADLTAVGDLHFPQFTHRGRFGNRPGHSTQHQDPDAEDEPGHEAGDDDLDRRETSDETGNDPEKYETVDDGMFGTPTAGAIGLILGVHTDRLEAFDDGGVGEAAAFAHRLQSEATAGALELAQKRAE